MLLRWMPAPRNRIERPRTGPDPRPRAALGPKNAVGGDAVGGRSAVDQLAGGGPEVVRVEVAALVITQLIAHGHPRGHRVPQSRRGCSPCTRLRGSCPTCCSRADPCLDRELSTFAARPTVPHPFSSARACRGKRPRPPCSRGCFASRPSRRQRWRTHMRRPRLTTVIGLS